MSTIAIRRDYAGVPYRTRQSQRCEAFLLASVQLFGTQGFRATSVRALCACAGYTERYFYESFENSEELLRKCYEAVVSRLAADLGREAARSDDEAFKAVLILLVQSLQDPSIHRLLLVEVLNVSPALDDAVQRTVDQLGAFIASLLPARSLAPLALHGLMGALLFMLRRLPLEASSSPAEVADIIERMLKATNLN